MFKKSINKLLLFAMVLSITLTSVSITTLAYTTNATETNGSYGVEDNGVFNEISSTSSKAKALKEMRTKALLRWTYPGQTQTYYFPIYGHTTDDDKSYIRRLDESGDGIQQYRGILYQQKEADYEYMTKASREHWLASGPLIENAITDMLAYPTNNELRRYLRGTDCSSSVCYAWRAALGHPERTCGILMSTVQHNNQFCSAYTCEKIVKDGNDTRARNGYGDYVNYVGNYTPSGSNTYVNLRDSIDDVYSDVYAYMQPGDFLVQNTATRSHVRLVEKVVIKRNSNNSINPYKSYVVISDQGSTIKDCTNNAYTNDDEKYYKTTWHVGYSGGKYTAPSGTKYNNYNFYKLAGKNNDGETRVYYLPYRYNGHTANYVIGFIPGNITESEIELNWNEQNPEYCNGFELVYATDADFSDAQTLIFNNPKKNNCTLRNLEKGKTYYIKMRAYNIHEDGKKEYSGYNNWLRINTNTKDVYRQNAPNPKEVSQKEYKEYVYDDISYEYELDK